MRCIRLLCVAVCVAGPVAACAGAAKSPASVSTSSREGVQTLPFDPQGDGDPASLCWSDGTLYIADNKNDQIWSWTDAAGFKKLVKVPRDPAATDTELGQIVRLSDGTLVVPRFGVGKSAAILHVNPTNGDAGVVPGIVPTRERVALARGETNLWGAYFGEGRSTDDAGVVTKVMFDGETDYAGGFQKPVSLLVHDGKLLVSDQSRNMIYELPLQGAAPPYRVYANVILPDELSEGPGGSIFSGQFRAPTKGEPMHVRQIFADGGVRNVAESVTFTRPKGVAWDDKGRRLFVADSDGKTVRTIKIVPL